MERNIFRSLNPTKKDLRVPSTIALEEVKAGMARVETSLKEEVQGLKATKEKLRIKVSILALKGQWPTECHALSQLQDQDPLLPVGSKLNPQLPTLFRIARQLIYMMNISLKWK
ncbi:hypothetical protein VNO80_06741 [Phaseolus coccineus]|uniref:Uncharacterized protein n=1 Tax=Phaseolus coccineus TaxID=3886 RepID=A0AAN9RP41_PHACN